MDEQVEEEKIDDVGDASDGAELHQLETSIEEASQHESSLSLIARYSDALVIKRVDSRLVRPLIIALGRSDNHALLATYARSLGVEYLGVEGFELSDLLREEARFKEWLIKNGSNRALFLAVIDSSIPSAALRSFLTAVERTGVAKISVRTTPEMLDSIINTDLTAGSDRHRDSLYLLSIARSPHNQIAIWPIITLGEDGTVREIAKVNSENWIGEVAIERAISEVSASSLVGALTYVIDPEDGSLIRREFGASTLAFWSESASYTTVTEQMVRAILDLPLGDTRIIDFEEFFLQEELEIDSRLVADPIRPFLHLFARNPRLKVRYLEDASESASEHGVAISISLFASSQEEALTEMSHARDFMRGS